MAAAILAAAIGFDARDDIDAYLTNQHTTVNPPEKAMVP